MASLKELLCLFITPATIVKDTDWVLDENTSRPIRGLRDYNRVITFSRDLKPEELSMVSGHLAAEALQRQIGWTGTGGYRLEGESSIYTFRTTWDSSD